MDNTTLEQDLKKFYKANPNKKPKKRISLEGFDIAKK